MKSFAFYDSVTFKTLTGASCDAAATVYFRAGVERRLTATIDPPHRRGETNQRLIHFKGKRDLHVVCRLPYSLITPPVPPSIRRLSKPRVRRTCTATSRVGCRRNQTVVFKGVWREDKSYQLRLKTGIFFFFFFPPPLLLTPLLGKAEVRLMNS